MLQRRSYLRPAIVVLVGLLLGWMVVATTMDRVFARRSPAIALKWNPDSTDANNRLADGMLQSGNPAHVAKRVTALAERSIRRQPVNPAAARLLGVAAAANGQERHAQKLMQYAEAMSRRDLPTQLWLIETSVTQGNVLNALRHYDRAMKTSVSGRTILFPILISAAADRAIWEPLVGVLVDRPQWWRPFVVQLVPASTSPEALYTIARRMGLDHGPGADPALVQAIERRLVDLGAVARAADLYNRAHGLLSGSGAPLRNGGFDRPGGWDPFDWNLIDEPDLAAVRQPSPLPGGGNALFLTANNGRGGDVAAQLVMLPVGHHLVRATIGGVSGDPLARPRFLIRCANDSRELLSVPFPAAEENGIPWTATFTVPTGCNAQRIVLQANSSLEPSDAAPWIDAIAIRPAGER